MMQPHPRPYPPCLAAHADIHENVPIILLFAVISVFSPAAVTNAHPGRTAADGCHYCRTNCYQWGVAWNVRHCHYGTAAPNTQTTLETAAPMTPAVAPVQGWIGTASEALAAFPVEAVVDGDTIKIKDSDGTIETLRLIGIDTPETVHPSKPVECFGVEASSHMTSLVAGKQVFIKQDTQSDTRDIYGRLLRYVYITEPDGRRVDVGAAMILGGFAYAYTRFPFDKSDVYLDLQRSAETMGSGLWADDACDNPDLASTTTAAQVATKRPLTPASQVAAPVQPAGYAGGVLVTGVILVLVGWGVWRHVKKRRPTIKDD